MMADALDQLARKLAEMYKENRNKPSTAPRRGKVIGTNPLIVQWGDRVIINEDRLVIPKLYTTGYEIPYHDGMITFKVNLTDGDEVIMAPDENLKIWYLIDKC